MDERSADGTTGGSEGLRALFEPASIAVVGASRTAGTLGHEYLRALQDGGFKGNLVPVNSSSSLLASLRCYPRLRAIPDPIDLAILAVPPAEAAVVADDCIEKGVKAVLLPSTRYEDNGEKALQEGRALVGKLREAGIRVVGPSAMGVVNTDPAVSLHATSAPIGPGPGSIMLLTRSGPLGISIFEMLRLLGLGISRFASLGPEGDVDEADLLESATDDVRTSCVLLYGSRPAGDRFALAARAAARRKPVVELEASGPPVSPGGILSARTLPELLDLGALFSTQPVPAGRRVAIVAGAGGPAAQAETACRANGLSLAPLSDYTEAELMALAPGRSGSSTPVALPAGSSPVDYRKAIRLVLADPGVDALLVLYTPALASDHGAFAFSIQDGATPPQGKTILLSFLGAQGTPGALAPLPCYPFPEAAAFALGRAAAYGEWRARETAG